MADPETLGPCYTTHFWGAIAKGRFQVRQAVVYSIGLFFPEPCASVVRLDLETTHMINAHVRVRDKSRKLEFTYCAADKVPQHAEKFRQLAPTAEAPAGGVWAVTAREAEGNRIFYLKVPIVYTVHKKPLRIDGRQDHAPAMGTFVCLVTVRTLDGQLRCWRSQPIVVYVCSRNVRFEPSKIIVHQRSHALWEALRWRCAGAPLPSPQPFPRSPPSSLSSSSSSSSSLLSGSTSAPTTPPPPPEGLEDRVHAAGVAPRVLRCALRQHDALPFSVLEAGARGGERAGWSDAALVTTQRGRRRGGRRVRKAAGGKQAGRRGAGGGRGESHDDDNDEDEDEDEDDEDDDDDDDVVEVDDDDSGGSWRRRAGKTPRLQGLLPGLAPVLQRRAAFGMGALQALSSSSPSMSPPSSGPLSGGLYDGALGFPVLAMPGRFSTPPATSPASSAPPRSPSKFSVSSSPSPSILDMLDPRTKRDANEELFGDTFSSLERSISLVKSLNQSSSSAASSRRSEFDPLRHHHLHQQQQRRQQQQQKQQHGMK